MIIPCEYCGREMRDSNIELHQSACIHNPDVRSAAWSALQSLAEGSFLPTMRAYNAESRRTEGVPHATSIMEGLGLTTWDDLAPLVGLRPRCERDQYQIEELHRIAQEIHDGQCGPSQVEWEVYRGPATYIGGHLPRIFGVSTWGDLLAFAGLEYGTKSYYMARSKEREAQAEQDAEVYILAQLNTPVEEYPPLPGVWKVRQTWDRKAERVENGRVRLGAFVPQVVYELR